MDPVFGPLGFKTLAVRDNPTFRLVSPSFPFDWHPLQLGGPAKCAREGHFHGVKGGSHPLDQVPFKGCTCGFYAAREHHIADLYARQHPDNVIVLFEGQGDVYLHTAGFRAQYARIVAVIRRLPGRELPADHLDKYQMWMVLAAQYFDVPLIEHPLAMQMATIQWQRYDALTKRTLAPA